MKKYLVIGDPIKHSLSPLLHNHWIKKNNIEAEYDKQKIDNNEFVNLIDKIKKKELNGINVTVPFKKEIIPFLEKLSSEAESTQSVNTIYLDNNAVVGHNTDIKGFELAIKDTRYDVVGKNVFILGAGGVVPSIIYALKKMNVSNITISNRTLSKAENLKDLFQYLKVVNWGQLPNCDMIINATSIGLEDKDKINLDFSTLGKNKFFFDVIYNPKETNFLKFGKKLGNDTANGKKMFIFQAAEAFKIWHGIYPEINKEIEALID
tara:strand:- start:221 stop:1012 length:792 start_codon:yes stop_codon:yes gene_type:complete